MRKLLYSLGLSAFVLFAGCSNDANENELGENINAEQNNQEEIIEENVTGENNEQNNEQEEPEQPEEKTVTATYEVNQGTWSITPLDDANEEVVLLTIDDAPDGHALEMAETLQALEANAIFFVNGHFLRSEEHTSELQSRGHLVCR